MARIAGVDLPRHQAGRDRPDLHLRHRRGRVEHHPREGRRRARHPRQGSVRGRRRPHPPGHRGGGRRRGRSPQGDLDEHQAADGDRLLPRACATAATCRCAASARRPTRAPARARARARSPARRRRPRSMAKMTKHGRSSTVSATPRRAQASPRASARRRSRSAARSDRAPRHRAHPGVVQQHDRDDHRHRGQRRRLVERRRHRLQGLAQGHAVRGASRRRPTAPATRQGRSACARSTCA